jgi:hypothetical protein
MAVLPDDRESILSRALLAVGRALGVRARAAVALAVAIGVALGATPGASAAVVDAVLADVNGTVLTLSDIALARALGLFGFSPSDGPVSRADVVRLMDARLAEREAARLEIEGSAAAVEEAWRAAGARAGGMAALTSWLAVTGIDPGWARQMVEADVRWRRFVEVRFRAFVFVADSDVTAALGTAGGTPEERERARQRLIEEATQRDLARWLEEARGSARIHYADAADASLPPPFAGPGLAR